MLSLLDLKDELDKLLNGAGNAVKQGIQNIQGNIQAIANPATRNQWMTGTFGTPMSQVPMPTYKNPIVNSIMQTSNSVLQNGGGNPFLQAGNYTNNNVIKPIIAQIPQIQQTVSRYAQNPSQILPDLNQQLQRNIAYQKTPQGQAEMYRQSLNMAMMMSAGPVEYGGSAPAPRIIQGNQGMISDIQPRLSSGEPIVQSPVQPTAKGSLKGLLAETPVQTEFRRNLGLTPGDAYSGEQLPWESGAGYQPPQSNEPINKVELPIQGKSLKERVQSAIVNAERIKNEISLRGKDAFNAGTKLNPSDLKLAEKYQEGVPIDETAQQAKNPDAFKKFMTKITDYYDFRLAVDRAVGGETPMRENYLRQRWDLSNPQDAARYSAIAQQQGVKTYKGFSYQPRIFQTYAEGEAQGFTRHNPNILGDLRDDYGAASNVLSKRTLIQGLHTADPNSVSLQGMGSTAEGKPFVNSNISGLEGISYHPDIHEQLKGYNPIQGKDLFTEIKNKGFIQGVKDTGVLNTIATFYDRASTPMKHFLLNFSGFHSINVSGNYAGAQIFHPIKSVVGLAESIPSFFSEDITQNIIDSFKEKTVPEKNYSVFDAGLRSGVNLDRGTTPTGLAKLNPFDAASRAIFDRELYTLKLNLIDQVFGDGTLDPQSPHGHAAGAEINKIMGEMNNRTMNIDPNTQKWLSRVFLAPGFTESKYATLTDAATKGGTAGNMARTAVIGKSIVFGTLSTLGTLLMTGKFPTLKNILLNFTINPTIQTNLTNPKGKKIDIALPATFISEPSKPIAGLLQGSTDNLTHYGQARLNPLLSTGLSAYTNKDYWGNPIVDSNSQTPVGQQLFENLGINKLPIGVQSVVSTLQKKITPVQALIQIFGLSTKVNPNNPATIYAVARQALYDQQSKPMQIKVDYFNTLKGNDPNTVAIKDLLLSKDTALYSYQRQLAFNTGNGDPLYTAPVPMVKTYLQYTYLNKLAPGSTEEKQYYKDNMAVLQQFSQLRSAYFQAHPIPGQAPYTSQAPQASPRAQQLMDAGNFKDPEVQDYLNANTIYKNQLRQAQGLSPLPSYTAYAKKPKKVPMFKIAKAKKVPFIKIKAAKMMKMMKVKPLKLKKLQNYHKFTIKA